MAKRRRTTPKFSAKQLKQYRALHDQLKELCYGLVEQQKNANLSSLVEITVTESE